MTSNNPRMRFGGSLFGLLFLFCASLISLPTIAQTLDNAGCLTCHDGKTGALEVPAKGGEKRELHHFTSQEYAQGVHGKMTCVACHTGIKENPAQGKGHARDPAAVPQKVDCAGCHQDLWKKAQESGKAGQNPQLETVVKNIAAYKTSFHARPNEDDKTQPNASCDNCHDTHTFNVPAKDTPAYEQWRLSTAVACGASCHDRQLKVFKRSIHGKEALEKHNPKAAVCTDCHSAHSVVNSSGEPFKRSITESCGSCHTDSLKTYKGTYHGQISALGYVYTAKCYNCHGGHDILKVDDPKSKVHPNNRMKTCESCHDGKKMSKAPPGFASFQPHGHPGDFKRYPEIWIAWQIMLGLLVGTFGFFWLHTLLWFYREFKERQERRAQPHVKLDELVEIPAKLRGKQFQRFSLTWRIAHLAFALSLMVLTLTGIPLFYPEAPWARTLMNLLGGPHTAGMIHRVSAVVFAGVFFWHLAYIGIKIGRDWKNFKIFGPNSLVPGPQDLKDMIAMFKWFFGMGKRPVFDRWTYWEKFDYWAPFWGVTIIGVSGLIMWFPELTGQVLPGWVFNVAAIFHGEEAFLAVVFLFTVHFFNNHFRPDKFPLERVMFTGTVTLEELKHDHPLQYQRLIESGELEKHLVDPPSPALYKASTILGFVLIVVGLTLLTLVGIGFFTSL